MLVEDCFPLLRHQMVYQNFFEADGSPPPWPPQTFPSPKFLLPRPPVMSHAWPAISCLRSQPSLPGSIGLLLQLDSIPYFWSPPPGSGIAATTGTGDLMATAPDSCVNNGSGEHGPFGLNVPSLPRNLDKALPDVGVEDLPDRGL